MTEMQLMFHVMLLAICLVCGGLIIDRDRKKYYLEEALVGCLFFFVPLELLYWLGRWIIG